MAKRVIIADDHPVFLLGLRSVLAHLPENYHIVDEAHNVDALFDLLAQHPVDLLITDFSMPGNKHRDGLRMINNIRQQYPELPIIVITMIADTKIVASLIAYRVRAILNKHSLSHELAKGLKSSFSTQDTYLSKQFVVPNSAMPLQDVKDALSPKEVEVIKLLARGLSVTEIATHLYRTKQTISAQKINAMRKLNIDNDSAFYRYLNQVGLSS